MLSSEDALSAQIANLHLFAGLTVEEAGDALGLSRATAYRNWKYARAWLRDALANHVYPSPWSQGGLAQLS